MQIENNHFFNEDFFSPNLNSILKPFVDGDLILDAIMTDVPYNIADKGKVTKYQGKIYSNKEAWGDSFKDSFTRPDYDEFIRQFLTLSFHILSPGGALITFIDRRYAGCLIDIAEKIGFNYKQIITFVKVNCVPKIRAYNYASATEVAVWLHKPGIKGTKTKPKIFNYQKPVKGTRHPDGALDIITYHNNYSSNVYFYNIGKKNTLHPTEKYEKMWEPLVMTHTNPGSIILDPFAGQFNLAHVCRNNNRVFYGIEILPDHFKTGIDIYKKKFSIV